MFDRLFALDEALPRLLPLLLVAIAIAILGTAWLSELYGDNLQIFGNRKLDPCQLCIVQRYPYALTVVLGAAAALLARQAMERTLILGVIAVVMVFGTFVSGFHVGVEYGWWPAGSTCSGGSELNFEDSIVLGQQIEPPVNCSDAAWRYPGENGLSMAAYNFILSLGLAVAVSIAAMASVRRLPGDA